MGYPSPARRKQMQGTAPGVPPSEPAAPAAAYCTAKPQRGDHLTAPCADCGHATVLHVGVTHCPVCELVDLNAKASATSDARIEVHVQGKPLTEQQLREAIRRHKPYSR
ncbi:hypothetical protein ACIO6U_02640 [Streptomyces sp. NPDC087422]|uniref:hypothetical protein n=1 Tax=Streptomyces sp. NPDC087422 TaxID=3365786 RepID=UPI003806F4A1